MNFSRFHYSTAKQSGRALNFTNLLRFQTAFNNVGYRIYRSNPLCYILWKIVEGGEELSHARAKPARFDPPRKKRVK